MMQFNEDSTNTFYMTLWEKTTIENPYYLFVFFDYVSNSKVKCIVQPDETNERYDKIIIVDKSNPNPDNGEVDLTFDSGEYTVYQKNSIDYDEDGIVVEVGLFRVIRTLTEKAIYDNDQERAVYNG